MSDTILRVDKFQPANGVRRIGELQAGDVLHCTRIEVAPTPTPKPTYELRPGAKAIYVSTSGDDNRLGHLPDAPCRTLFEATLRLADGNGDHLCMRRGDRWDGEYFPRWQVSGFDAEFPCVIGAYGEGPRPIVAPGNRSGFEQRTQAVKHVAIDGIEFAGPDDVLAQRQSGIVTLGPMNDFTIRDCVIRQFAMNINANSFRGDVVSNFRILDSVIADSIATRAKPDGTVGLAHSSGIFLNGIEGASIEGCTIVGNGWREQFGRSALNHGVYSQGNVKGFVFRDNIVHRNSLNGVMARTGGVIEGNVLSGNTGNVFGTGRNEYPELSTGAIRGNLVIATEFSGLAWGFTVHEVDGVEIADNMILNANSTEPNTRGLLLNLTVRNVNVTGNHIQNHGHALDLGVTDATGTTIEGNTFVAPEGRVFVRGAGIDTSDNETRVAGAHPYTLSDDFEERARAQTVTAAEIIAAAKEAR